MENPKGKITAARQNSTTEIRINNKPFIFERIHHATY